MNNPKRNTKKLYNRKNDNANILWANPYFIVISAVPINEMKDNDNIIFKIKFNILLLINLLITSLPFQNIPLARIIREISQNNDVLWISAKYDNGFSVRFTSFAKYKHINGEIIPIRIDVKIYIFLIYFSFLTVSLDVIYFTDSIICYNVSKNYTNFIFDDYKYGY